MTAHVAIKNSFLEDLFCPEMLDHYIFVSLKKLIKISICRHNDCHYRKDLSDHNLQDTNYFLPVL